MLNLILFIQNLDKKLPKIYYEYKKLVDENIVINPIIYTDNYNLFIDSNLPMFPTFYIRNHFNKNFILLDYYDLKYIPQYMKKHCIVLYDQTSISDTDKKNCYKFIKYNDNIKEKIYDV
jgi:hypothetical protein